MKSPDRKNSTEAIRELSGLLAQNKGPNLYGVADNGVLVELDQDGGILRRADIGDGDYEGLTWGRDGELWVIGERRAEVLRIDPATFEIRGKIQLPIYEARERPNKGYEGIVFDGENRIYLVNERPAVLLTLKEKNGAWKITDKIKLPAKRVNDFLVLSDGRGFVILSKDQGLRLVSAKGKARGDWYELQEESLEGLALIPGVGLFLVADLDPSTLIALTNFKSEEDLLSILGER